MIRKKIIKTQYDTENNINTTREYVKIICVKNNTCQILYNTLNINTPIARSNLYAQSNLTFYTVDICIYHQISKLVSILIYDK